MAVGAFSHQTQKNAEQERRWLEENREAIDTYNRRVAQHGLLSDHTGLIGCDRYRPRP
jgi:post-segregation antitoxin (ccd killing protein)